VKPKYLYPDQKGNIVVYMLKNNTRITKDDLYMVMQELIILEQFGYYEDGSLPWDHVESLLEVFVKWVQENHTGRDVEEVLADLLHNHYEEISQKIELLM
jgi:hypothetical protein